MTHDQQRQRSLAKILTTATVAAALVAGGGGEDSEALASDAVDESAVADETAVLDETAYGYDDLDMDGDSERDADEFHEWSEGPVFAFYMQRELIEDPTAPDQTDPLDTVVLVDALYNVWDVDDDGALDEAEWDAATDVVRGLSDTEAAWVEFDVDGNDIIDVDEVKAQLESDVVLAAIDADESGTIEDQELNEWFFALFDVDENGMVSRDEWRLAEHYFDVPVL